MCECNLTKLKDLTEISILTDLEEKFPTASFENLSKKISGVMIKSDPQYTIGIHGEWGTGKTTLMKTIQKQFLEDGKEWVPTVWFNAWRYEREDAKATVPLILTMLEGLAEIIVKNHEKEEWFERQKYRLKKYVKGWSLNLSIPILFGNVDLSLDGNRGDDVDYKNFPKPNIQEGLELILKFCTQIETELSNKLKLIVFVDDLDRCSPKKALEVLESIKILLDIKGIVFVIGMSHDTIDKLISAEYEKSRIRGRDYLEKIIQIPTDVPIWEDTDFKELLDNNFQSILESKHYKILEGKEELLFAAVKGNPRQLKRLINNIILSVEIYGKKEGIQAEALLSVELMRSLWPDTYKDFCVRQSFRDLVQENLDESKRSETLSIVKKKNRDETQSINENEKSLMNISNDLWTFFINTQNNLFKIEDWKIYRSITATSENSNSKIGTIFGSSSLYTLSGHTHTIRYIAVTPDGKIISGSFDDTLKIWDIATGKLLHTLEGHTDFVYIVRITPDGKIISGSFDGTLKIW